MFRYTVRCEFESGADVIHDWLAWLQDEHIDDVLAAGATSAEIVKMEADPPTYEIRYGFEGRSAFKTYESQHAPRLREEGLSRFPLELGLSYSRTTGEVLRQW